MTGRCGVSRPRTGRRRVGRCFSVASIALASGRGMHGRGPTRRNQDGVRCHSAMSLSDARAIQPESVKYVVSFSAGRGWKDIASRSAQLHPESRLALTAADGDARARCEVASTTVDSVHSARRRSTGADSSSAPVGEGRPVGLRATSRLSALSNMGSSQAGHWHRSRLQCGRSLPTLAMPVLRRAVIVDRSDNIPDRSPA